MAKKSNGIPGHISGATGVVPFINMGGTEEGTKKANYDRGSFKDPTRHYAPRMTRTPDNPSDVYSGLEKKAYTSAPSASSPKSSYESPILFGPYANSANRATYDSLTMRRRNPYNKAA